MPSFETGECDFDRPAAEVATNQPSEPTEGHHARGCWSQLIGMGQTFQAPNVSECMAQSVASCPESLE